jgi:integrase
MVAPAWENSGFVFHKPSGTTGVHSRLSSKLDEDLRDAGLPDMHFHVLRHTAATLMIRSGVPIRVVADVLGQRGPAVTLRRSAHVLSDMQDDAAQRMDQYAF